MFVDADMRNPVFDETYINSVIKRLDSPQFKECLELVEGPYTVFAFRSAVETSDFGSQLDIISPSEFDDIASVQDDRFAWSADDSTAEKCFSTSQDHLSHLLVPFLSVSSAEERRLLRFWVTSASELMISTNHPENPFREIVIPLVLESASSTHKLPGHYALLYSIYAFAALNRSQIQEPPNEQDALMAAEYHQDGLRYLRQSMMDDSYGQHVTILASIIMMTSIDIAAARSSQWRIHVRGGREWLRSLVGKWNETKEGRILRQLFNCVEIVGYSLDQHTRFAANARVFFEDGWDVDAFSSTTTVPASDDYSLHKFYGITKPVLRAIFDISRLSMSNHLSKGEEVEVLRSTLLLANPITLRFPSPTTELEKLTRHHACSWYYACMIHYERSLQCSPPREIQHLVEQCLYHFEAIEALEDNNSTVEGLLWPLFVSACEAQEEELRRRCMQMFARKSKKGVVAIACVEGVILELWHHRDMSPEEDIVRQQVMEDLEVDILLR
jgi:hypothetical protein